MSFPRRSTGSSHRPFRIIRQPSNVGPVLRRVPTSEQLEKRLVLASAVSLHEYQLASSEWFQIGSVIDREAISGASLLEDAAAETRQLASTGDHRIPPSRWIVRLSRQSLGGIKSPPDVQQLLATAGEDFTVVRGLGLPGQVLVESSMNERRIEESLRNNLHVAYFEPEQNVSGAAETTPESFEAIGLADGSPVGDSAWKRIQAGGDPRPGSYGVVVGVIDSGIDLRHPDLYQNIWINQGEIPHEIRVQLSDVDGDGLVTFFDLNQDVNIEKNLVREQELDGNDYIDAIDLLRDPRWADDIDTDNNSFRDDLVGWDFHNGDNNPMDDHRHGTHVAGTIGAVGANDFGVQGTNWEVSLMALKFLDEDLVASTSEAVLAINYATMMRRDNGVNVRVTNSSWGIQSEGLGPDAGALVDAIEGSAAADILFVAAAGNGVGGIGVDNDQTPFLPASYSVENVISVAATDLDAGLARFSNYGLTSVDIAAPGVGIVSTELGGTTEEDAFQSRNGTSMAAPHVAGVAALLSAERPGAGALEIRAAIMEGAEQDGLLRDVVGGGRRLQAHGAVTATTFAPGSTLLEIEDITEGKLTQTITVRFSDEDGIDLTSLGDDDIVIKRSGFGEGTLITAQLISEIPSTSDPVTVFDAIYQIAAPVHAFGIGRGWHAVDNGRYQIELQFGQVKDLEGISNGRRTLCTNPGNDGARCGFEVDIEDPTVFHVTNVNDVPSAALTDDTITLRSAVELANQLEEATIVLPNGVYAFDTPSGAEEDSASSGDLDVHTQLNIIGSEAVRTTIDARGIDRIFDIQPMATLNIIGVTLMNGRATNGGAIRNEGRLAMGNSVVRNNVAARDGGGIFNAGVVGVTESAIDNNSTSSPLGKGGGAIFNKGVLYIELSTLAHNSSAGGFVGTGGGGGIYNSTSDADVEIVNSTFSGNDAVNGDGGGIFHVAGTANLTHLTITENRAETGMAGGVFAHCDGGTGCSVNMRNSIVAGNIAQADVDVAGRFHSLDTNLIGIVGAAIGFEEALAGSENAPLDPGLGPLLDNGGLTNRPWPSPEIQTHALLAHSPAIGAAFGRGLIDQRGIARPADVALVADIASPDSQLSGIVVADNVEGRIEFAEFGGELYFSATHGGTGRELWKTDGTTDGTTLVADISPGSGDSDPREFVEFGGRLYFQADDGRNGLEVWVTDGTTDGTSLVADVFPGFDGSNPHGFVEFNGALYFAATHPDSGRELWRTDGTTNGTTLFADISPGPDGSHPLELIQLGGNLYFEANDGTAGSALWTTDGTADGTSLVADINVVSTEFPSLADLFGGVMREFTMLGGELFFAGNDGQTGGELWKTDGTKDGTVRVADIVPGPFGSAPTKFTVLGEHLFFLANDGSTGGLWKTDGTELGTIRLADVPHPILGPELTVFGGELYFNGVDDSGSELWKTDGTDGGTVRVVDISLGPNSSDPSDFLEFDGELFFSANDGTTGSELWKTDGTEDGTVRVFDYQTGVDDDTYPTNLTIVNGLLIFAAFDRSVFSSDRRVLVGIHDTRTNETSLLNVESRIDPPSSRPSALTDFRGEFYFTAHDSAGSELWKTDGTTEGTFRVADIFPGDGSSIPFYYTELNGELFFSANDGSTGDELWKTDGTPAGTVLVADIDSGDSGSFPSYFTELNGELFFAADDGITGEELWKTNGTELGTVRVADIAPEDSAFGPADSDPAEFTELNGELYFSADDGSTGTELWKTDGTEHGTVRVADIASGSDYSNPTGFTRLDGELFFAADDGLSGFELWKTDGTEAGTVQVADINTSGIVLGGVNFDGSYPEDLTEFRGELYFAAYDGGNGFELWKTGGSGATKVTTGMNRDGTVLDNIVLDISDDQDLVEFDGDLYFSAHDGVTGFELWKTDGTPAGTVQVADIDHLDGGSYPAGFTVVGGELYFSAWEAETGRELWKTNGSSEGTVRVADILPGVGSSFPSYLKDIGGELYFSADDGVTGRELRKLTPRQSIGSVERFFGQVAGMVFEDANRDGRRAPSEGGLAGWTVFTDLNGNSLLDLREPHAVTRADDPETAADESGGYVIDGLVSGNYTLRLVPQSDFDSTIPVDARAKQEIAIAPVVDTREDQPVDELTFANLQKQPAIVGGRIVFQDEQFQLYSADKSGLFSLVLSDSPLPGIEAPTVIGPSLSHGGDRVAFSVLDGDGNSSVLVVDQFGVASEVADESTISPSGDAPFRGQSLIVESIVDELVAFGVREERSSEATALFADTSNDDPVVLADEETTVPGRDAKFRGFEAVDLDAGSYALQGSFVEQDTIQFGIYVGDGPESLTTAVDTNTRIPRGDGTFDEFHTLSYSSGEVAFRGLGSERFIGFRSIRQDGIYLANASGRLDVIADTSTSIPFGESSFTSFDVVSQDRGNAVFIGNGLNGQHGIYTNLGGELRKVVDVDPTDQPKAIDESGALVPLFGDRIPRQYNIGAEAISGNQIVFHVTFIDSSEGIYVATYPSESQHLVSLDVAEFVTDTDFGVSAASGEIRGQIFNDFNGDRAKDDGELGLGLSDWVVCLDQNHNLFCDIGEPTPEDGIDENGNFVFENLPALTTYFVIQEPIENWAQTFPTARTSGRWEVFLEAGEVRRGVDFGTQSQGRVGGVALGTGVISGQVFHDANENGVLDEDENGLSGRRVFLDLDNDRFFDKGEDVPADEPTDDDGNYSFSNLETTTYLVRLDVDSDEAQTTPLQNVLTPLDRFAVTENPIPDVGDFPTSIRSADLNADGRTDLIVANNLTNNISILLQDELGSFFESKQTVGLGPISVAAADLNSDGVLDLAVANFHDHTISSLLGGGDGTFADALPIELQQHGVTKPSALVAEDFDGDGRVDLAVAAGTSEGILAILFNETDGAEATGVRFGTPALVRDIGDTPVALEAGVLYGQIDDAENHIDLAVVNLLDNNVIVVRNDGNRTFSVAEKINVGEEPNALVIAELNDDGHNDLAVANSAGNSTTVSLLLSELENDNDVGTVRLPFRAQPIQADGSGPSSISVADVDGDHDDDLIVTVGGNGPIPLSILRNNGDGTFEDGRRLGGVADTRRADRSATTALTVSTANLTGDTAPDIALADAQKNTISVFRNDVFSDAQRVPLGVGDVVTGRNFGVRQLINQNPTLDPITDYAIRQDGDIRDIPLTGISAGAGEVQDLRLTAEIVRDSDQEASIQWRFDLNAVDGITYFSPDRTGVVSIQSISGKTGTTRVIVTVHDSGLDGVPNNADDAHFARTFSVTVLASEPVRLPGDADGDGLVQFSDFLLLAANFGSVNREWEHGDFDNDGEVGFSDFLILSENFGSEQAAQRILQASNESASGPNLIIPSPRDVSLVPDEDKRLAADRIDAAFADDLLAESPAHRF